MNELRPPAGVERDPGSLLASIMATSHRLEATVETALGRAGLSLAKLGVLRALGGAREPMSLSQLAERNQCVRSNITQLVDRLEADGLVRRVDDPRDRRVIRATLTPAGRNAVTRGEGIMTEMERQVARAVSEADAAAVRRALGHLTG